MKRLIPTRGAEDEAFSGWRHVVCYLTRARIRKKFKRQFNKRERRHLKHELTRSARIPTPDG